MAIIRRSPSHKFEARKQSILFIFFWAMWRKRAITFEVRPDPELIIKSVLEHFPYLKFGNSFRGIDNYDFTSPQPWSSPCPICDGKHGNYGLHGSWYCENGNQFPYDPELAKLLSQDKLEYCLTCNSSSNKLKFAIVAYLPQYHRHFFHPHVIFVAFKFWLAQLNW